MPKFNEDAFTQILKTSAATVLSVPPTAVPTDLLTMLMSFITGIFTNCFNPSPAPSPTPTTSAQIAAQLKGANVVQRGMIRQRTIRYFLQQGKSRQDGVNAYNIMQMSVDQAAPTDLAQAIQDARDDVAMIPDFSQI